MIDFSDFYREFQSAASDLPEEFKTEERSRGYYTHLVELDRRGREFNLTAITDPAEALHKHVIDSLHAAKEVSHLAQGRRAALLDVGSGGGFPALPIAISCDNVSVTSLDATAKKCAFIADTAKRCGVMVDVLPDRAEAAAATRRESFDLVTARAVARLNILLEICAPFVTVGGYFIAMKGSAAEEERLEAECASKILGLSPEGSVEYEIKDGGRRSLLIYKKIAPTPASYPRKYPQIKKKPL